jgi:hypothetical protein
MKKKQQAETSVRGVIDRMKLAVGAETDGELEAVLGGGRVVAGWRSRGSTPYAECEQIAKQNGVSLDWLLLGSDDCAGLVFVPMYGEETITAGVSATLLAGMRQGAGGSDGEVVAWIADDGTMTPSVAPGDLVLVDTSVTALETDGLYLLSIHGRPTLRRVQNLHNGYVRLSCDNRLYDPADVSDSMLTVIGRPFSAMKLIR